MYLQANIMLLYKAYMTASDKWEERKVGMTWIYLLFLFLYLLNAAEQFQMSYVTDMVLNQPYDHHGFFEGYGATSALLRSQVYSAELLVPTDRKGSLNCSLRAQEHAHTHTRCLCMSVLCLTHSV